MTKEMITKRLQIIGDLTTELNSLKETYQDMLEDDSQYQEMQELEDQMKLERKEKKARVQINTGYLVAEEEIKEKRREIRENREALSQGLVEYYKNEGKLEIVDHEGNIKRLKFSVRLVN